MSSTSIELYESLKRLTKQQFNEVCFYLREKYGYDLSYIALDGAPAESANQLIELVKQNSQGLNHLEEVLEAVIDGKTSSVETPKPDTPFDKKRLIALLSDCPCLRSSETRRSLLTLLPTDIADNITIGYSIKEDVLELVNKCLNYPNGMTELFKAVRFFDDKTLPFQALSDFLDIQELTPASSPPAVLAKLETPITQLMAQLHLSSQVSARDEFTKHNHHSLQLIREAMVQLKQLSPQTPDYSRVSLIIGSVLSSTGELLQAERLFTQVVENTDNSAEKALAHFNLFQVQLRRKVYPDALENLQTAIQINPHYALHDLHKYPIERLLGAGGMGCVFLCQNRNRLIRYARVVVKCFWEQPKGTLDEVFKEPFAMRDIAGDYIPEPLDFGYVDVIKQQRAYFVTAYVDEAIDGEAWLEKYGPMDLETGLQVGLQIANGLQIAHDAGICHLDLKPANILLLKKTSDVLKTSDVSVSVKIIDFGLSQAVPSLQQKAMTMQQNQNRAGFSQFGQAIFGTLDYACPEQQGFTQYGKPGVQCDVFAFGRTMYRLFTGLNPRYFRERNLPKVDALQKLLGDCVEENPKKRPESIQQVVEMVEKLPRGWLGIHFGTSAIAVAIGMADSLYFLPLQKLVDEENPALNFGDYNDSNTENRLIFLPSHVSCDADLRQGDTQNEKIRKGFPRYKPASLKPGEPDFVSLPATMLRLAKYPGRVIYSPLKWLAQPSETIPLGDSIELFDFGIKEVIKTNKLPVSKLVESSLAALAEAYITVDRRFQKGRPVVLTYPNTFTPFYKQKLHDIAWQALNQRLGIDLPGHIRLISETDALAYHYCRHRVNKFFTGWERLFIYNFEEDKLDLSLIHVHWNKAGTSPERWQVENCLSIPIAGNYLDTLLARLIDSLLKNQSVLDPAIFEYRYPVVAKQLGSKSDKHRWANNNDLPYINSLANRWANNDLPHTNSPASDELSLSDIALELQKLADESKQDKHRQVICELWENIQQAKHRIEWQKGKVFRVEVGCWGDIAVVINVSKEDQETEYNKLQQRFKKPDIPRLELEEDNDDICLKMPAETVHHYPPLREFIEFVTEMVVDEFLQASGVAAEDVNTVLIYGKEALWPGLREHIWNKFGHCEKPDLIDENKRVEIEIVSGAIAWQALNQLQSHGPKITPRLGILLEQTQTLILEEDWEKGPIDLSSTTTFRIVQVSLKYPNPKQDFKSLRRHFYIFLKQVSCETETRLVVSKQKHSEGQFLITLQSIEGQGTSFLMPVGGFSQVSTPPWPFGSVLLEPDEQQ